MVFTGRKATTGTQLVREARDFLFENSHEYDKAIARFKWPELTEFNFALEWFDVVAGEYPDRAAVTIVSADLSSKSWSYAELAIRSDQVANWLLSIGIKRGDHLLVMLNNTIELWEIMLGIAKIGAVSVPTSTLLSATDLEYRAEKGEAAAIIALSSVADRAQLLPENVLRIAVTPGVSDSVPAGWIEFAESLTAAARFEPTEPTPADDTCLLYFTSGTTKKPKLVQHTQVSYPVGHLSTMWWLGLREGDVHLNISSPGWAKHAWSSFYAPFLAGATVFVFNYQRFDASELMRVMGLHKVSTFCAPPTVWRMLIQADLGQLKTPPRELLGAGEPLNPEVINRVRTVWGGTIRDGFGQTETTCCIGNSPGQPIKEGSMGRPTPGYPVVIVDPDSGSILDGEAEGEVCLDLSLPAAGLMKGYYKDLEATGSSRAGNLHHTGDIAFRDAEGYLTYVGRADDVFKASDYKISPFELESILLEHEFVAEAAIVPSPDELRLAVPKAYICLTATALAEVSQAKAAESIFRHARERLSAHQRVRIIEFVEELPKTISGKIRRVELRAREALRVQSGDESGQYRENTN